MSAPNRDRVEAQGNIPVSLKRQAERVVIERARELVTRHPEMPDFADMNEAVRVLDTLEGKKP